MSEEMERQVFTPTFLFVGALVRMFVWCHSFAQSNR